MTTFNPLIAPVPGRSTENQRLICEALSTAIAVNRTQADDASDRRAKRAANARADTIDDVFTSFSNDPRTTVRSREAAKVVVYSLRTAAVAEHKRADETTDPATASRFDRTADAKEALAVVFVNDPQEAIQ